MSWLTETSPAAAAAMDRVATRHASDTAAIERWNANRRGDRPYRPGYPNEYPARQIRAVLDRAFAAGLRDARRDLERQFATLRRLTTSPTTASILRQYRKR